MLRNKHISDQTNQSYYSKNFQDYRKEGIKNQFGHRGILPHRYYTADFWEETIPLILNFLKKTRSNS